MHSCLDSSHINQFRTSTHVLESWTELRSQYTLLRAIFKYSGKNEEMVHVHQKPVSQAKQTSCDKPDFFKQERRSWPCASLQVAWCRNFKSMRKLEIFNFLHCNKSLLYTVPSCKSPNASFICLVQQLEAPELPREISAFITSRKILLFESTIPF